MEESKKSKELFEKYKWMKAQINGKLTGIVVGWSCHPKFVVVELNKPVGWRLNNKGRHFIGKEYKEKEGNRYWYASEDEIIK